MAETAVQDLADEFEYLDGLRESGRTNMWGSVTYLMAERLLPKDEAIQVFNQWKATFDGKSTPLERAERA